MPASEVMRLYRQHKLHSGPGGPVVKKKTQATAIQISMARKEGHHIPEVKGSFQQGGLVPETGDYQVHQGEEVRQKQPMWFYNRHNEPHISEDTGLAYGPPEINIHSAPTGDLRSHDTMRNVQAPMVTHHNFPEHESPGHGLAPVPPQRRIADEPEPSAQAQDIASRTRGAEEAAYHKAMHTRSSPLDLFKGPPASTSASYAIEGLKGNVAQRMHEQGVRGSFDQGGTVQQSGDYEVHQGEELVPPERISAPGPTSTIQDTAKKGAHIGSDDNPQLKAMAAAVNAPLQRVEGFKRGGRIPSTGIYRLHAGEQVIPKNLAQRYRQMKERHG